MNSVEQRIKDFNKSFDKKWLDIKYQRMAENAFSFFRGTCHLFYEDLHKELPPSPIGWICGDLHPENFGSFKSNNRLVYFDLNDFGEGILAPVSWELTRMITAIYISLEEIKIKPAIIKEAASLFLEKYCDTLRKGKAIYIERQIAEGIVADFLDTVKDRKQKKLLEDRTYKKGNKLRLLIDDEKHFAIDPLLKEQLHDLIIRWSVESNALLNYQCIDIAFRVAGTGSIGINRYCFLFQGKKKKNNYLLLDMKEVTPSSLSPYVSIPQPEWKSEAHRVCAVQEFMQNTCPALLSPVNFNNVSYVIKELQPSSDKIDFKLLKKKKDDLFQVIKDMAVLTASAQLRSSGRKGAAVADELISFADNNKLSQISSIGKSYSKRNKEYYTSFLHR